MAFKLFSKPMQLQPVTVEENDELIQAINKDPLGNGDVFNLQEELDPENLNKFLDAALEDAASENAKSQGEVFTS